MSEKTIYISRDGTAYSGYYALDTTKPEPGGDGMWKCRKGHLIMFADEFERMFGFKLEAGTSCQAKVSMIVGEMRSL